MYLQSRSRRWLRVLRHAETHLRLAAQSVMAYAAAPPGARVLSERDQQVLTLEAREAINLTFESQAPAEGTWLAETLGDVRAAVESFGYGEQFDNSLAALTAAVEKAIPLLTARTTEPDPSIDEIIDELARAFLISLIVTLTSHNVLLNKADEWDRHHKRFLQGGKVAGDVGHYFDIKTLSLVDEEGTGRVHMQHLVSAIDAGATVWMAGAGSGNVDNYPEAQSIAYAQWFSYAYSLWEEQFRGRIANYFDSQTDDRIRRSDVLIDYFGDIRLIRNDFVHNKGVCKESAGAQVLKWEFECGQPMEITAAQMMSLVDLFPHDLLRLMPVPHPPGPGERVPGKVDPQLLEDVQSKARVLGLGDNQLLEAALRAWLDEEGAAPKSI